MPFYAHSKNSIGKRQNLADHLISVAEAARDSASKFGSGDLGYYAGLWHDVGKVDPAFQEYLQQCELEPERKHRGPDHKALGAKEVTKLHHLLAFLVKGHHGGLPSRVELKNWLPNVALSEATWISLMDLKRDLPQLLDKPPLPTPPFIQSDPLKAEFYIRMLFSALVDADFLDTEAHFSPDISSIRSKPFDFQDLWKRFLEDQEQLTGKVKNPVNQIRHEVYEACLRASELPRGLFRLTVPTGGGKTRSALAFALKHAMKHSLDRIIVAIPFTSIIEQTAQVYRDILGSEPVLEHHSMVNYEERDDEGDAYFSWLRLAAENWDSPVIITTTVQLFESLFSKSTSKCRKLHNTTGSVIILDEVQSLPVPLLEPILDAIHQLIYHYGVSVVLCTATQPEYSTVSSLGKVGQITEIVPGMGRLFSGLKRISYQWPRAGEKWGWRQVADEMRGLKQVLAVVNTKKDAIALLDAIADQGTLHLSTLLCGAHRRDVLNEVKKRLAQGDPCRLVSTQVVEAGVDIDFPVVFRAIGPLDSMVQSAGRCNREGRLSTGRVVVFVPEEGGMPPGAYRAGADTAKSLMHKAYFDIDNPDIFSTYFRMLYQSQETDAEGIQELRSALDYPKVASVFRMIKDETFPVIVLYQGFDERDNVISHLIEEFRSPGFAPQRSTIRRLQPYMVNIRAYDLERYRKEGLIRELAKGLYEWLGGYDPVRGLDARAIAPADLII